MEVFLILGVVFLAYEVLRLQSGSAMQTSINPNAGGGPLPLPSYQTVAPQQSDATQIESSAVQGADLAITSVSKALNFVPIVGPIITTAFNAIAGGLIAASAKRAAAARSENAAVAAAVPGWDKAVVQVVAAYNAGQLSAPEVQQFLNVPQVNDPSLPSSQGLLWKNFWNECGPQIQAGRNGCQTGTVTQPPGVSFCSGSYGASCCVGYDNLKNSCVYMLQALAKAEANPGSSQGATVVAVYGSKYGGINRPSYTVTFRKPAPASGLLSSIGL